MALDVKKVATLGLLGLAGYIAYLYYIESTADNSGMETDPSNGAVNQGTGILQTVYENLMNNTGLQNWMTQNEGPTYLPVLNAAEVQFGIPTNLLARMAYQESRFRPDIISGATQSPAGAVGIMQLMPQFFPGAGQNPATDIQTAAQYLASLYNEFGDWQVAVAAYNDGPGNLKAYLAGTKTLPLETQNYVTQIMADVPVTGSMVQV